MISNTKVIIGNVKIHIRDNEGVETIENTNIREIRYLEVSRVQVLR